MKYNKKKSITVASGNIPEPQVMLAPAIEPFDQWWTRFARANGHTPNLRIAVESHMKARGFWENRNWEAGIRDFGLGRQS